MKPLRGDLFAVHSILCIDVNECGSNPCLNGATCRDLVNGYSCSCAPGYTGMHCESKRRLVVRRSCMRALREDLFMTHSILDINECSSSPCQNGATCKDLMKKYTCSCVPGYTGIHCESGKG